MDSKAKGIGEALAILGVIASLGFVAAEIRQNTAAVRGATLAYRLPFFAWWWAQNGDLFAPDFQTVVEREFLPLSGSVRDTS